MQSTHEECLQELARQFAEVARAYFGSGEELREFYEYFISSVGGSEFRRLLDLEAWEVEIVPALKGSPLYMKKVNASKEAITAGQKFYMDVRRGDNKKCTTLERFEIESMDGDYAYASGRGWVIASTEVNKWYSEIKG